MSLNLGPALFMGLCWVRDATAAALLRVPPPLWPPPCTLAQHATIEHDGSTDLRAPLA